jgi:hypothetical protein
MLLLIFLFGSYIINVLKIVSPPPVKVQTKPVDLRKLTNPWPMRKIHYTRPPPAFSAHHLEKTGSSILSTYSA